MAKTRHLSLLNANCRMEVYNRSGGNKYYLILSIAIKVIALKMMKVIALKMMKVIALKMKTGIALKMMKVMNLIKL